MDLKTARANGDNHFVNYFQDVAESTGKACKKIQAAFDEANKASAQLNQIFWNDDDEDSEHQRCYPEQARFETLSAICRVFDHIAKTLDL